MREALAAFRRAVANRGGGVRGAVAVAARAWSIVRALGLRGLAGRLRSAARAVQPRPPVRSLPRPAALPLAQVRLRVGIALHLFHGDLLAEFREALARMPVPFDLLVSVPDDAARARAQEGFAALPGLRALHVRVVANRGRDWAPLLVDFRDEVQALDVVCHVHSKKSLYTGRRRDDWRGALLASLLGSPARIGWILGMFEADPRLGLVFPDTHPTIPHWAHGWLRNAEQGAELARRLGFDIDPDASFDYPVGAMFWARVDALAPLLQLGLRSADFPPETGQTDGTLQHALERLVAPAALHAGYRLGILPADGSEAMADQGRRNWWQALDADVATRFRNAVIDADAVSVDIFDTLVLRPFLSPDGFRDHIGHIAATRGWADYAASRRQAEQAARLADGRDPGLDDIRRALERLRPELPAAELLRLEREADAAGLRVRPALAAALAHAGSRPVVAVSDTYYRAAELRAMLPAEIGQRLGEIRASCETGERKDSGAAWRAIAAAPGVDRSRWLHVGDHPGSDVQRPLDLGFHPPLHVPGPAALLQLVPALRPLHPGPAAQVAWQDSLWLGLVANRLSCIADADPACFRDDDSFVVPDAETLGYVVLGPLLHDFVAWTAREALRTGTRELWFLAREGWLFEQCFQRLAASSPRLQGVRGWYFLASRRATGLAGVREAGDLARLFAGSFTGTFAALLEARLGTEAAEAARAHGIDGTMVFLPEMQDEVARRLAPAWPALREAAEAGREAWRVHVASLLEGEGAGTPAPMVVDIGYSGTIQDNLRHVLERPLLGAYMALRRTAPAGEAMRARYFDGRDGGDASSSPILRNDLLLEALLTAPAPQLSHFAREHGRVVPRYVEGTAPADLALVGAVHAGALGFVDDLHRVAGADALDMAFDRDLAQAALACIADGTWRLGAWADGLAVDDHHSGRGVVKPSA